MPIHQNRYFFIRMIREIIIATIIVPLQSWGGSFNFSIWHVQLWGISEDNQVEDALANLHQVYFVITPLILLCLLN